MSTQWLLGPSEAAVTPAWARWHIAVHPTAGESMHDALLHAIDRSGHLRVRVPASLPVDDGISAIDTVALT
jgi:hypothetical protein